MDSEGQDRLQNQNSSSNYSASNQQYATANQLTTYKVQSNQYGASGERITNSDEDDRPASRLKQNIDDLDTLLYDLNNARHLSTEKDTTKSHHGSQDANITPTSTTKTSAANNI